MKTDILRKTTTMRRTSKHLLYTFLTNKHKFNFRQLLIKPLLLSKLQFCIILVLLLFRIRSVECYSREAV